MLERLPISQMAGALAAHAAQRQSTIAQNVANADTPGYKAKDISPFASLVEEQGLGLRATRPGHLGVREGLAPAESLLRHGEASPNGNDVALEDEMIASAETRASHEMALGIYRSVSTLLRTSLGRTS